MRLLALFAAALFAGSLVSADDKKAKEDKPKDADAIVGTWKPEKIEVGDGKALPAEQFAKLVYVYQAGGKLEVRVDGKAAVSGEYTLDPAADPKGIDQVTPNGKGTRTEKGIYRLDGDALTLCLPADYQPERPAAFKAEAGKTVVITLKRVKGDTKDEPKKDK